MKLIIEIDNEAYKGLVTEGHIFVKHIFESVKNGTPIPDNATNGDVFKQIFGVYATELWAKPESEFLEWLNGRNQKGGK